MSLIAYHNGRIIADRTAMTYVEPFNVTQMQKLHISHTKQFAWVYCGRRIHSRILPKVHDIIYSALLNAYLTDELPNLKEFKDNHEAADRTMFILTSDRIYYWNGRDIEELEYSDKLSHGTNGSAFRAASTFFENDDITAATMACEFITGRTAIIDSITMGELNPFIINEV